ncbi:hypothetical protein T10_1214 [Trichinella papuae]|uniref:Uncharacterized protein n=1 Tax=Trichinella papuae TaxID=268474 RepID=A0A0V1M3S7_9BILA|nr:hypothetical protein T10_1214 [Trichinella papuae]
MDPVHRGGSTTVYFLLDPRSSREDGTCVIPVYSAETVCETRNHKIPRRLIRSVSVERNTLILDIDHELKLLDLPPRVVNDFERIESLNCRSNTRQSEEPDDRPTTRVKSVLHFGATSREPSRVLQDNQFKESLNR